MKIDKRVVWLLVKGAVVLAGFWLEARRGSRRGWSRADVARGEVPWVDVT